jgi:hypothetical protein
MGLLADSANLLEDNAERVAPAVQRTRDDQRVSILRDELTKELAAPDTPNRAKNIAALNTELRAMGATPAAAKPRLLTSAISALDDGGKFDPATAPKPEPSVQERAGGAVKTAAGNAVDSAVAPAKGALEVLGSAATGTGQAIMGGWRGLAALASGAGLEEAARQVHAPELAGGNTATAYEPAAGSPAAEANKVIGVPSEIVAGAGRMGGRVTMDVTGSPAAATAVETGINAVPLALLKSGKTTAAASAREIVPAMARDTTNYDVPTYQRRGAKVEAPAAVEAPTGGPMIELPKFTEPAVVAPQGKSFAPAEQAARAAVLQRVGIEDARQSAINGNLKEAATDYQQAKLDNPAGDYIRRKLDAERQALQNHGEQVVRDTGGTPGVDAQRSRRAGT